MRNGAQIGVAVMVRQARRCAGMSVLLLFAAAATPVVTVRATARIVSAAQVGANVPARDPRDAPPAVRAARDPATGTALRLTEYQ